MVGTHFFQKFYSIAERQIIASYVDAWIL